MPDHYFGMLSLGREFLRYSVGLAGVCSFLFIFIAVIDGFRFKTYGLTPLALVTFLAQWLVSVAGPFTRYMYLWMHDWMSNAIQFGAPSLFGIVIFAQYLRYGPQQHPLAPGIVDRYHVLAWLGLIVSAVGCWTFIVYHQDFFVNEVQPTQNLIASASLLGAVFLREDVRGLSVIGAWFYFAGNLILYGGMYAGQMSDPYPVAQFGYYYLYWMWSLMLVLNVAYAVLLQRRKRDGSIRRISIARGGS